MVYFAIDEAYLIGGWLASAMWGAFSVLFTYCMYFIFKTRRADRSKVTTGAVIILYLLATAHNALILRRLIEGFILFRDTINPVDYMANIGSPINRAKDLIYITSVVVGDLVIVWRCFMVWSKNYYVLAAPAMMWLSTAIGGLGAIGQYFLTNPDPITSEAWGRAMFITSMITNITVTILTASRVWWLSRSISSTGMYSTSTVRYRTIILLIIESGALITSAKIIEFTLYEVAPGGGLTEGINALYIVFDCMPQIAGIVPTMIIAATNAKFTSTDTAGSISFSGGTTTGQSSLRFAPRFFGGTSSNSSNVKAEKAFALQPMGSSTSEPSLDP